MVYDIYALNEAYEEGQFDFFFSINESTNGTVISLLSKINRLNTLVRYRGPIGMGRDLIRKRTPEEEREYQNSIKYERMKAKIKRKAKDKKEYSLAEKVLFALAGVVFAVPIAIIIFLGLTLFMGTVFLGIYVGMVLELIKKLLDGTTNVLLSFLDNLKLLINKLAK